MRSLVCIDGAHNPAAAGPRVQIPPPQPNFYSTAVAYRVYVIQNREGQFYIGLSDDLVRRVEQHNTGRSHWTRERGPCEIVWQSEDLPLTDARKLENRLKRQGRGKGFYAITGLHRRGS
jgi:predicted GIY-YIG superfamily endonuclease